MLTTEQIKIIEEALGKNAEVISWNDNEALIKVYLDKGFETRVIPLNKPRKNHDPIN